jgi:uncharacterized protein
MTPQERDLITTLLARLQSTTSAGQPKDPEADALIRQELAGQPDAPYYLVQTVLIQDLSLHQAQNRIAELERQLNDADAPRSSGTSFLGNLFGHREAPPPAPQPAGGGSVPSGGPWVRGPQVAPPQPGPGYAQPSYAQPGYGGGMTGGMGGGGFLRSAAATAAGIAGGALLFQGISSLFGHGYANSLYGGMGGIGGYNPGLGETVINNYYGDGAGGGDFGGGGDYGADAGGGDYGGGDAGGDDYGGDAGGGDFGGGDDTSC